MIIFLGLSVAVQPGNFGGPVCNIRGQVVGVVRAQMNARSGFQNVNYAVKSGYVLPLLRAANVPTSYSVGMHDDRKDNPHENAQNAVAMILV